MMACKAREALQDILTAVERLGIFPDGMVARNARIALASDDCVPREVAEEWSNKLLASNARENQLIREKRLTREVLEQAREALKPFAKYHRERCRLAPKTSRIDSNIPDLSYGNAMIGDKHFRAADAVLATLDKALERST